jgi:hypothetical protein
MRGFGELLQAFDGLVGRNQTQYIVNDSFNSASEQGHNATHDASLELSRLMSLLFLTDLVLFQASVDLCTRFRVIEKCV